MSIKQARKRTLVVKGQVAQGINPNDERKQLRGEITFGEMFQDYMERYSKREKKSWKYNERRI